jgi:hypothetical protein
MSIDTEVEDVSKVCIDILRLRGSDDDTEPASNDEGYTEFKNAFLDVVSCIMLPMVAKALSHDMDIVPQADYVALRQGVYAGGGDPFATLRETIRIALTGTGTGYMKKSPNVTHLSRAIACVCGQLYQFESEIVDAEGYVYIDGENMLFPDHTHLWNRSTFRELDEDVQQMFENDILCDHKDYPTTVMYHKSKPGSRFENSSGLNLFDACGLDCSLDCSSFDKEIDDVVLVASAATRALLSDVPVTVYSHDQYKWLDRQGLAEIGVNLTFIRPELSRGTDSGFKMECSDLVPKKDTTRWGGGRIKPNYVTPLILASATFCMALVGSAW